LRGRDNGPALRVAAHQGRSRPRRLEIDAEADRIGDARAIIELQHRHGAIGIDRPEGFRELLAMAQIDLHGRQRDALLGQEDTDPPRARRRRIIEFHGDLVGGRLAVPRNPR